jgi:hypothetical protein
MSFQLSIQGAAVTADDVRAAFETLIKNLRAEGDTGVTGTWTFNDGSTVQQGSEVDVPLVSIPVEGAVPPEPILVDPTLPVVPSDQQQGGIITPPTIMPLGDPVTDTTPTDPTLPVGTPPVPDPSTTDVPVATTDPTVVDTTDTEDEIGAVEVGNMINAAINTHEEEFHAGDTPAAV